jgi:Fur family peroxide stress response transcriptional regulator
MQPAIIARRMKQFAERCSGLGLAATHQRRVIYRVLAESEEHPHPETVYRRVKRQIPTISLATVYKNIKTFVGMGLLQEVGSQPGSYRVDANLDRHHHLVCIKCRAVVDFYDSRLDRIRATEANPKNFRVLRYQVEALGVCPACRLKANSTKMKRRGHYGKSRKTSR